MVAVDERQTPIHTISTTYDAATAMMNSVMIVYIHHDTSGRAAELASTTTPKLSRRMVKRGDILGGDLESGVIWS